MLVDTTPIRVELDMGGTWDDVTAQLDRVDIQESYPFAWTPRNLYAESIVGPTRCRVEVVLSRPASPAYRTVRQLRIHRRGDPPLLVRVRDCQPRYTVDLRTEREGQIVQYAFRGDGLPALGTPDPTP